MLVPNRNVKSLLLAGGISSRMGSPKYLLELPDGRPLYLNSIDILRNAGLADTTVYISVRNEEQIKSFSPVADIQFVIDTGTAHSNSIGPAAGLLAAHAHDMKAHWLVLGCDYPFITTSTVKQLLEEHEGLLTCFNGQDGYYEPLLAIWSPTALAQLKSNVEKGHTGPMRVVKQLESKVIQPHDPRSIVGVNSKDDWERAFRVLATSFAG